MILSFKKQFIDKIIDGTKIHTIRKDSKGRWKVGMKIHFATGVRTKNYNQFAEGEVSAIHNIKLVRTKRDYGMSDILETRAYIDDKEVNVEELAKNDGFDNTKDLVWFFFPKDKTGKFEGRLIKWK